MKFWVIISAALFNALFVMGQGNQNVFLKFGTTGIGLGYEHELNPKISLKSAISYLDFKPSIIHKGIENQHKIQSRVNFAQLEFAVKWYPKAKTTGYGINSSNRFFLIGGILIRDKGDYIFSSNYKKFNPNSQVDDKDTLTGTLNIKLETNLLQPFLGFGFELTPKDNIWSFTLETALSYHGTSPTVPFKNFYETGKMRLYETQFEKWVKIPQMMRLVKIYPILNFTIGRRF